MNCGRTGVKNGKKFLKHNVEGAKVDFEIETRFCRVTMGCLKKQDSDRIRITHIESTKKAHRSHI